MASLTSRVAFIGVLKQVFPFSVGQCHCLCQKTVMTIRQDGEDEVSVKYREKAEQTGDAFLLRLTKLWDFPPLLRSSSHALFFGLFCLRKPILSKKLYTPIMCITFNWKLQRSYSSGVALCLSVQCIDHEMVRYRKCLRTPRNSLHKEGKGEGLKQ